MTLLIDQDGRELCHFDANKFSVKLQQIGAENSFGQSLCTVSIQQSKLMYRPLAVGIYQSRRMAESVAKELLAADKASKPYFVMPPAAITALELFERLAPEIYGNAPDD